MVKKTELTEDLTASEELQKKRDDVLYKISRAETIGADWHAPIAHRRDLYHREHYKGLGKIRDGETRYVDPTYTNTVDLAIGILHANDFRWHVYGWTPSVEDTQASSSIEKYLAGTIYTNSLREEEDIRLEITTSFVRDGVAVVYSVWDPEEASAQKIKMKELSEESDEGEESVSVYKETPVIMKVIDPLEIYLIPGGKNRWSAVVHEEMMTVYDAEQKFGEVFTKYSHLSMADKMDTTIRYADYWEIEEVEGKKVVRNAKVVDNVVVKDLVDMAGYLYLPYTVAFFTNDMKSDPKFWVKTIIDVLENSVPMLETAVNRRQYLIDRFVGLPMTATTRNNRPIAVDKSLNVITLQDGEKVEFPTWPGSAPDVDAQMALFRSRIQQSGFSESMYGTQNGVSGYADSQESDQNRIRLTQPVTNLQLFWTQWARKLLSMTEEFAKKSKVRVYGRVHGKDFDTLVPGADITSYVVECRIKPDFPQERTRNHAMASQVKGILSDETVMSEYLGIEQPDDERQRKLIEMAQNHQTAQQYAILLTMKKMAEGGDEVAALAYEMVKNEVAAAKAVKQEQTGAIQPTGLASSTGELTPQEGGGMPPGQSQQEQMNRMARTAPNMGGGV